MQAHDCQERFRLDPLVETPTNMETRILPGFWKMMAVGISRSLGDAVERAIPSLKVESPNWKAFLVHLPDIGGWPPSDS